MLRTADITTGEFAAMNALRRGGDAVIAASDRYRSGVIVGAVATKGHGEFYHAPISHRFWTDEGEAWVRELCDRYAAAWRANDLGAELECAREWIATAGTLAAVNIAREVGA